MHNALITGILIGVFCVAGSLVPVGSTLADENHGFGKSKSSHGVMMKEHHMPGYDRTRGHHRSLSPLEMKDELGLSDGQVKTLEPLESNYRKASIKNRADLKIAMIDLSTLLDQKSPDKNAISKKVDEIGTIQKSMMLYRVEAMLELKDILTPPQYKKFRGKLKGHMEHGIGGSQSRLGEMMHHGTTGEHRTGHEKMGGPGK